MPTQPDADPVRLQIEALRKKLLDLTLRNRMLNYRPSKRLGITVVGESSLEVHRLLVEEAKKMSFEGRPDPPRNPSGSREIPGLEDDVAMAEFRQAAEEEMDAYLLNAAMPRNQMDTRLGTEEFESVLQAKLRTVMREANLADEELGINTLFLTPGTLEWCETDQRTFRAPLLFVPVKLEKLANGSIRVLHDGSDVGENLPLRAKISEFNFRLPVYDDEKTVLDYFDEVESTVRKRADWTVHRNDICLAFFNYEKYAMYVDLGGDSWPEDRKPWQNPDAIAMLGTGYSSPESDIDDHSFIDDHRPIAEAREVYDADSSQTLAILRAQAGLSVVVEGPRHGQVSDDHEHHCRVSRGGQVSTLRLCQASRIGCRQTQIGGSRTRRDVPRPARQDDKPPRVLLRNQANREPFDAGSRRRSSSGETRLAPGATERA